MTPDLIRAVRKAAERAAVRTEDDWFWDRDHIESVAVSAVVKALRFLVDELERAENDGA